MARRAACGCFCQRGTSGAVPECATRPPRTCSIRGGPPWPLVDSAPAQAACDPLSCSASTPVRGRIRICVRPPPHLSVAQSKERAPARNSTAPSASSDEAHELPFGERHLTLNWTPVVGMLFDERNENLVCKRTWLTQPRIGTDHYIFFGHPLIEFNLLRPRRRAFGFMTK